MPEQATFMVENAQILFPNFSGEPSKFNATGGKRTFCCKLGQEESSDMAKDGWNIKMLHAREEGDEDQPYISVTVAYRIKPPKVTLITSSTRTLLTEDLVGTLDWADLRQVDFIAQAYDWTMPDGKSGRTAYLKTMFATVEEDELEMKYAALAAMQ